MATKRSNIYGEPVEAIEADVNSDIPLVGFMEVTKVVHEEVPIRGSENGVSVGSWIDQYLAQASHRGENIQDLSLHFEPNQWNELREFYRKNFPKS